MSAYKRRSTTLSDPLALAISAALFDADPAGINYGFNGDEYDPEASAILARLATCTGPADVQTVIHHVLVNAFCRELIGPRSRYAGLAGEMWKRAKEAVPT